MASFDLSRIIREHHSLVTNGLSLYRVFHDATLTGDGTSAIPLSVVSSGGGGSCAFFPEILNNSSQNANYHVALGGSSQSRTDPVHTQSPLPVDGIFSSLYVRINDTLLDGVSLVVTFVVNGNPTNLTVSVPDASVPGLWSDIAHSVVVSAGDLVQIKVSVIGPDTNSPCFVNDGDIATSVAFSS